MKLKKCFILLLNLGIYQVKKIFNRMSCNLFIKIVLLLSGGAELLVGNQKKHEIELPDDKKCK